MDDLKQKVDIINHLHQKMDRYAQYSSEKFTSEDREMVINYLLQGEPRNKGGLTAMRGFVYQYYVAIHYMLDMMYAKSSEEVWWNEVIIELLDDIVLFGEGRVRFVQVKTVLEGGTANHLTQSNLVDRKKGLSWLDRLFLNVPDFETKQAILKRKDLISKEFTIEFEIATNAQYDEDVLAVYSLNDKFDLDMKKKHEKDKLTVSLLKPLSKKNNKEHDEDVHDKSKYKEVEDFYREMDKGAEWCLQRFRLNRLGPFDSLRMELIKKISTYTFDGYATLHDSICGIILQKFLTYIIDRSHRDGDGLNIKSLVFTKKELKEQMNRWMQEAELTIYAATQSRVIKAHFDKCFDSIQKDIDLKWSSSLRKELSSCLTWLRGELSNQISQDPFVYERFLQRLFYLTDSSEKVHFDESDDLSLLRKSLKYLILCLVFYTERQFTQTGAKLLFKQGKEGNEWMTFIMYNTRQLDEYDDAERNVLMNAQNCPQALQTGMKYCFIFDFKKKSRRKAIRNAEVVNRSIVKVVIDEEKESREASITNLSLDIKFHKGDFLEDMWNYYEEEQTFLSFVDVKIKDEWHQLLEEDE